MANTIKTNRDLVDLASDLQGFIQKNGWISRYDLESDAFSLTVPKLSKDTRIKYFDDEIAFYITSTNNIEGIFVEYFKSNFVKHHKDLKPVVKEIKKEKAKKDQGLIKLSRKEINQITPDLEEAIKTLLTERLTQGNAMHAR